MDVFAQYQWAALWAQKYEFKDDWQLDSAHIGWLVELWTHVANQNDVTVLDYVKNGI